MDPANDPRLQCSACLSYLNSLQLECCIKSCFPFPDRIFNPNAKRYPVYNGIRAQQMKLSKKTYSLEPVRVEELPPPKRSVETLPEILRFDVTETVVHSGAWIPARSLFGPLVAPSKPRLSSSIAKYAFESGTSWRDFILDSDEECNWMKFVDSAENIEDQNVTAFHFDGNVYFAVIKDIQIGDELKVWYADHYAAELGKPFLSWISPAEKTDASASYSEENVMNESDVDIASFFQHDNIPSFERNDFIGELESGQPEIETDSLFTMSDLSGLQSDDGAQFEPDESPEKNYSVATDVESDPSPAYLETPSSSYSSRPEVEVNSPSHSTNSDLDGRSEPEDSPFDWICGKCGITSRNVVEMTEHSASHHKVPKHRNRDPASGSSPRFPEASGVQQEENNRPPKKQKTSSGVTGTRVLRSSTKEPSKKLPEYESGDDESFVKGDSSNYSEDPAETNSCDSDNEEENHGDKVEENESTETKERNPADPANSRRRAAFKFSCEICQKKFKSEAGLEKHMSRKHSGDTPTRRCGICLQQVDSNSKELYKHKKTHVDADGKHPCPFCPVVLDSSTLAFHHVSENHKEVPESWKCYLCGYVTHRMDKLHQHLQAHKSVKHYPCNTCGMNLTTYNMLRDHMVSDHDVEDQIIGPKPARKSGYSRCIYCDFEDFRLNVVASHAEEKHAVDGVFPCRECENTYDTYKQAKNHTRAHRPMEFKCKVCGFAHSSRARLDDHVRSHYEPKVECPDCGRFFMTRATLKFHQISQHGAQAKVECLVCGKFLKNKATLKIHQVSQHSQAQLEDHVRVHSEPRVECLECGKFLKTRRTMRSHQILQHGAKKLKQGHKLCNVSGKSKIM